MQTFNNDRRHEESAELARLTAEYMKTKKVLVLQPGECRGTEIQAGNRRVIAERRKEFRKANGGKTALK